MLWAAAPGVCPDTLGGCQAQEQGEAARRRGSKEQGSRLVRRREAAAAGDCLETLQAVIWKLHTSYKRSHGGCRRLPRSALTVCLLHWPRGRVCARWPQAARALVSACVRACARVCVRVCLLAWPQVAHMAVVHSRCSSGMSTVAIRIYSTHTQYTRTHERTQDEDRRRQGLTNTLTHPQPSCVS